MAADRKQTDKSMSSTSLLGQLFLLSSSFLRLDWRRDGSSLKEKQNNKKSTNHKQLQTEKKAGKSKDAVPPRAIGLQRRNPSYDVVYGLICQVKTSTQRWKPTNEKCAPNGPWCTVCSYLQYYCYPLSQPLLSLVTIVPGTGWLCFLKYT